MSSIKLAVEVLDAHELMAKDGEDSSDPFVELRFDRQKFRTTTKDKDLNPVWNEKFYFNITDPSLLHDLTLSAFVYHYKKSNSSRVFLGKVCLTRTSFVPYPDAVALHYPLERRFFFSPFRVSGELGLKVFVTDDPSLRSPNNLFREPSIDSDQFSTHDATLTSSILNMFSRKRNQFRQKYHNVPNSDQEEGEEQPSSPPTGENPTINSGMHEVKSGLAPPKVVGGGYAGSLPLKDRALKEISSFLGVTRFIHGNKLASTYDLVEPMHYLFVRVVKARDLPSNILIGGIDPYVQVKVGNFEGATFHWEKTLDPEWHQVFAFARDDLQSTKLQVRLRDKRTMIKDDIVGTVKFDLHEVPTRIPPNSPLAPEWYRIDKCWDKKKGELMLAVWFGTQADEAFPDAWHSDAPSLGISSSSAYAQIRSKVYHSPRLWYLQVRVIEAQDLYLSEDCEIQISDAYVKLQLGNQILKTRPVQSRNMNLRWDQELMFIAAEPLEEPLIVSVENRVDPDHIETIGIAVIPLTNVYKRADDKVIRTRWYALEDERKDDDDPVSTIHLSVCLEGGYHVFDESNHNYSSDLRPTSRQLWKEPIGILELGILSINGLHPMKTRGGKGTSDTYCVAKYGQKWIRTRTIADSVKPKYNEQYSWEVYDPATVLTVGVFDNVQLGGSDGNDDLKLGKVRIRISTLETGRVYKNSYPLLMLHPSGVKKMAELHLAIRFSCSSMVDMMRMYFKPPLPKMHYKLPLNIRKQERLRQEAVNVVAARFGNAEPPLRKEVVEFMSDTDSHLWSMRRSKANFYRLMTLISGLLSLGGWLEEVCIWKHPLTTLVVHILFVMLVCFPGVIMPAMLLYMFAIGMWNLRFRLRHPPHMSTRISYPDGLSPDELDEEFDTFPTTKSHDTVCLRYDRLRTVAMRIQGLVGDLATQGERFQALVNWRDPHATALFMAFCIVAAIVLYVTPFQFPIVLAGFYIMRHPTFRSKIPSAPLNFFLRLPSLTDSML
ncbi:FT-interacting protein 3-like [Gastrolobium bilobum]|uniref:FT-interacting protein 3-like n=1 Tax=Gastrolobium bilobum TaxID=150636 RepID=UPI002AB0A74D|nr:FT-interacting protein 3-like [Gastrolobium bilobum]